MKNQRETQVIHVMGALHISMWSPPCALAICTLTRDRVVIPSRPELFQSIPVHSSHYSPIHCSPRVNRRGQSCNLMSPRPDVLSIVGIPAALLRILEAMDMAVPPPATEEEATAAAAASAKAHLLQCGESDRPLRLAFRTLLAYLTVRPQC